MHKKWNTYVYLESDTTNRNFEAGITKFMVTRCPIQFTRCTKLRFLWQCLWKSFVAFTLSNSVLCDTLQNTALYIVLHPIYAVHCSAFLHSFPGLVLASLCTHATWVLRLFLQLSMCHWNPIYGIDCPTILPFGLLVWPCTWIFVPALACCAWQSGMFCFCGRWLVRALNSGAKEQRMASCHTKMWTKSFRSLWMNVVVNEWRAAWVGCCSSMRRWRFYMKTVGSTLGAAAARSSPETCRGSP